MAYIPDRNRERTHDGIAGLAISDRRLVYHTPILDEQARVSEPVEARLSMRGGRGELEIKTSSLHIMHFRVDQAGVHDLHHALTIGKFKVSWRAG